jgi:hypothetical protein
MDLMLVEHFRPSLGDDTELTTIINSQKLEIAERVASAALFSGQLLLTAGRAHVNGHNATIPHTYRTDLLIKTDRLPDGALEVGYQHSAFVAGLLEGHMEVQKAREAEGLPPTNRLFAFVHATTGVFYDNLHLENVNTSPSGQKKHTAFFTFSPDHHADYDENEIIIVPIDDIYCVNYALPEISETS